MAIRRLTSEFGTDLIAEGDIATGAVTTDKIAADAITSTKIATDAVGTTAIVAGAVGVTEMGTTLDLSSKTVTVPAATVTAHVTQFDDSKIRNDVGTLALHSAIANNRVAHNLPNVYVDQFEDESQVTLTTATRTNEAIAVSGSAVLPITIDVVGTVAPSITESPPVSTGSSIKIAVGSGNHLHWDMEDAGAGYFDRGSGDWTIEFWIRLDGNTSASTPYISVMAASDTAAVNSTEYGQGSGANVVDILISNVVNETYYRLQGNAPAILTHTNKANSVYGIGPTWKHLAVVRHGNLHKFYGDGTFVNSIDIAPSVTLSCTTQTSTTVLVPGVTSAIIVGQVVSGVGVPLGATVVSIVTNTSFVLSSAATASATIDLTFSYTGVLNNMRHFYVSNPAAYIDDFRVSDIARYTHITGTLGTPSPRFSMDANTKILIQSLSVSDPILETTRLPVPVAAGSIVGANQPQLSASVTKMGIIVLYKELGSGTTTLNTDIVVQISANGGTNWTNATLVDAGTFSTGIKTASTSTAVTLGVGGDIPKYQITFANQSAVKNTEIHGVALLY